MMKQTCTNLFIFLLFSLSAFSQQDVIQRYMEEKKDEKAMHHILVELQDMTDAEINEFINIFIAECDKQEREYLKQQVIMRLYVCSLPKQPTGALRELFRSYGILLGDVAPDFDIAEGKKLYEHLGAKTLLFFYETTCNLCHEQKNELIMNYQSLEEKGYTIVGIDCNVEQASTQPWEYTLADPKGEIYHPYGILSTPTFILLDKEGKVKQRERKFGMLIID